MVQINRIPVLVSCHNEFKHVSSCRWWVVVTIVSYGSAYCADCTELSAVIQPIQRPGIFRGVTGVKNKLSCK